MCSHRLLGCLLFFFLCSVGKTKKDSTSASQHTQPSSAGVSKIRKLNEKKRMLSALGEARTHDPTVPSHVMATLSV